MKARRKIKLLSLAVITIIIASANVSFSQDEYDDMYFNSADRKEVKFNENVNKVNTGADDMDSKVMAKNTAKSDIINPTYSPTEYGDLDESYSAKTVNPEYIERYKDNPKGTSGTAEIAEGDSYYDDYYERAVMPGETDEKGSEKVNYPYPSSYYGGYNAMSRSRMYRNPWYDPFYGGGFAPGFSMSLGYSFGMMPGFSMGMGYGTGMGYGGYNPYGFYDPFSPFGNPYYGGYYDPFYSPYAYNSMYRNSMMYGYGGPGYYCPSPFNAYGSGYGSSYVAVPVSGGSQASNTAAEAESNTLRAPTYRTRASRGSDRVTGDTQDVPNTRRTLATTRSATNERGSNANARLANERDFSRSQNEYYTRNGSRNATSTVSASTTGRSSTYTSSRDLESSITNTSAARVRSSRSNSTYSRPSYKSSREQRSVTSGSSSRRSWNNSGTYRSSRSSGNSSYTPSRSSGSSYSGSSGSSIRSSSSSGRSSGSISSGGSRSSGSSGGGTRSGRGN
jgi:hypothetical protein